MPVQSIQMKTQTLTDGEYRDRNFQNGGLSRDAGVTGIREIWISRCIEVVRTPEISPHGSDTAVNKYAGLTKDGEHPRSHVETTHSERDRTYPHLVDSAQKRVKLVPKKVMGHRLRWRRQRTGKGCQGRSIPGMEMRADFSFPSFFQVK